MMTKGNILIVDDTPANLNLLGDILEQAEFNVRKAPSGVFALNSVGEELPDLILLDIKMPGMDGYEVCEQLKANKKTRDIPVIFISAMQETRDKVKAFSAGGVDYITKPFQSAEVLARVNTHIRLHFLQQDLIHAREKAEAANHAKGAFLANMSHEFRTPMNAILNFTDLCRQNDLIPEKEMGYLDNVSHSAESLLGLINDILSFSRIESGRLELESLSFNPEKTINSVVSCMRALAHGKQLDLCLEIPEALPTIEGDPLRLKQIFTNLLANAIKFTESGRIKVTARCETMTDKEIILAFSIEDSGIGMDDETVARLFRAFTQADSSTTRQYGGIGLGLAISKQLVELMGGEIRVESTLGQGSVFTFTVRSKAVEAEPVTRTSEISAARSKSTQLDPIRRASLLLVEDNLLNQVLTRTLLTREQFQVDVANNGKEAVEMASCKLYDCILMDVQMPVMDGHEATRRIRKDKRYQGRPILSITANTMQEDREKCLAAGMDEFLTKPVVPDTLFAALVRWIPPTNFAV